MIEANVLLLEGDIKIILEKIKTELNTVFSSHKFLLKDNIYVNICREYNNINIEVSKEEKLFSLPFNEKNKMWG